LFFRVNTLRGHDTIPLLTLTSRTITKVSSKINKPLVSFKSTPPRKSKPLAKIVKSYCARINGNIKEIKYKIQNSGIGHQIFFKGTIA
jgi:hypothetical protein